jgi:hypothetical protein
MNMEVCWDGLWTLSYGLSQFHGHGSWLVCEVAFTMDDPLSWHVGPSCSLLPKSLLCTLNIKELAKGHELALDTLRLFSQITQRCH